MRSVFDKVEGPSDSVEIKLTEKIEGSNNNKPIFLFLISFSSAEYAKRGIRFRRL